MKRIILLLLAIGILSFIPHRSVAQSTATIRGTVTDANGQALAGANILLIESSQGAATDTDGAYEIDNIDPGTYTIRVTFVGFQRIQQKITLEAGQTLTKDFAMKATSVMGEDITVVVGSRAQHTAADELAVPVDIFTPEQITTLGTTETSQILEKVAPSVNFPHQTVADGTDAVRPFTLRGLSPDHTLVLINGKRRHPTALVHRLGSGIQEGSSGVDLNAIPSNAIGSMQVLRDGAAAQYGSDAIAGVVNVVLKSGAIAPRFTGKIGEYAPDSYDADGATYDITGEYGLNLNDKGFLNVFGQYRYRNPTNRAGADPRDQVVAGDADVVDANGNVTQKNNPVPQPNHHWGDGKAEDAYIWWNGEYTIDEDSNTKLYSFGGYSHRNSLAQGFYRRSMDSRNWPSIYPIGFLPNFDTPVVDYSASLGLKGQWGEWNYDLNSVYGYNNFEFNITNSLNASLGPNIPPNQTSFYAGAEALKQWDNTLDFYRSVDIGLAKPMNVALGASFRYENFLVDPGEPASYEKGSFDNQNGGDAAPGAQVFPGFTPQSKVDESRTNLSLYADLEANLTEEFLVNVAGRFESYSDFGETAIGKLALRYQPAEAITFRSAISTGFRAPNLSQQYFSKVSTIFQTGPSGGTIPYEVGLFRTDSDVAKALGAKPLTDEKSVNISGGLAVTPVSNLTLTADYYFVRINDRIILSGTLSGPEIEALVSPFGAQRAQYFSNAIDTRTQGIDITGNYRVNLNSSSTLNFNGSFNYNKTDIIGQVQNPPQLEGFEEQIFGFEARTKLTKEHPETKARLTARYKNNRFNAMLSGTRYGKVVDADDTPSQVQTLSSKVLFDLEAGYQIVDAIKLSVGANNIFDIFPDKTIDANNFLGIFPYPRSSPWGFNGRFIYSKVEITL
ncbi:MAG: TonB-dependent receptor [Balneolaceae bacterium]|jgi:iron complex outermembrane receptor protein